MIEVPVFNLEGGQVGTVQVDEAKLGGEVRPRPCSSRPSCITTPTSARVRSARSARGEGRRLAPRKLFKQKGTGNARTGGIRNPIKVGGGHAKQKRPKSWRQRPEQEEPSSPLAINAILAKIQGNQLKIVDALTLSRSRRPSSSPRPSRSCRSSGPSWSGSTSRTPPVLQSAARNIPNDQA